jgi:hypothetical protein
MPTSGPPPDARRLLVERNAAREARDWPRADALRDELAAMGWEVQDLATRSTLRPILRPTERERLPSLLAEPAEVTCSIQVVADDHPDDLGRLLRGLATHPPEVDWELVVVVNRPSFDVDARWRTPASRSSRRGSGHRSDSGGRMLARWASAARGAR